MSLTDRLKTRAKALKRELHVLVRVCQDRRIGWVPRVLVGVAIAYALSPIDLIPDFIPVLGLLDDLVVVPALLALAIRHVPRAVLTDVRARVDDEIAYPRRGPRVMAGIVIVVWLALLAGVARLLWIVVR